MTEDTEAAGDRLPKLAGKALERLVEYNQAIEYHLTDGRAKLRENWLYTDGAMADALTQLARQREYIRTNLDQLLRRLERQLRERDARIAALAQELARHQLDD
jgi:ABC-type transporter Mla subunit MlaD